MRTYHDPADRMDEGNAVTACSSGITLTLEGPDGPSSVELSTTDCLDLADAVANSGTANAEGSSLDRILLVRFPPGSPVVQWATAAANRADREAAARAPAVLPGNAVDESARITGLLDALHGSLVQSPVAAVSAPGRLLLQVVGLVRDACRHRVAFEQAVVEARIESMKQLAYGAGHEINNPLANIATRAQSLLPGERDPERRRRLAAIIDQAFRARDMIGGLMLFARPPKPVRAEATAQSIVAASVDAVAAAAEARGVRICVDAAERPLVGSWDRSQLEEAVRAVLTNAIEAGRDGGQVRVVVVAEGGEPPTCCVRIVDDGPGMDRETLAKVFDPFFSGREAGRGIGLGLSKVWRLVEINGGRTMIDSRYGSGTTVTLMLPMA